MLLNIAVFVHVVEACMQTKLLRNRQLRKESNERGTPNLILVFFWRYQASYASFLIMHPYDFGRLPRHALGAPRKDVML